MISTIVVLLSLLLVLADLAAARGGKDGREEVRVTGICGPGATSTLRLRSRDQGIELEFEVDRNRVGTRWRIVIVHERRVAWRGTATTSGTSGSFAIERRLPDRLGSDTVTARAWGPAGLTCVATATLAGR